jgi:peroxiredoxin Q/BCP
MSKKTRKKSSKPSTGKAIRAQSATSAKKAATKSSTNTKNRQTGKATAKASHKAPLKKLKSPSPAKSSPRAALTPKPAAAKPAIAKPAVAKPAVAKATATKPAIVDSPLKKPSSEKANESAASRPAPAAASAPLAEGSKAPAFSLPRDGGSTVSLHDYAGKKLVLFFYPRADTPGCTKEAIDFTRLAGAFADAQTVVLGVSADPPKAQEAFRNKHELSTPLVSDEQHEMLEAYDVWGEKSMYGRTFLGVFRTTVLIGKDGRINRIWRHVKVDGHADEVLAAAQDD